MPAELTLFEQLAFSTIRIECDLADGSVSTGTGFFFQFAEEPGGAVPAIVTNKHVIRDSTVGHLYFTLSTPEGEPDVGKGFGWRVENFQVPWIHHPDPEVDLCALPIATLHEQALAAGKTFFIKNLDWSQVPSDQEAEDFLGMERIVMVGYPNGIWDRLHNFPVFRSGVAATHYRYDWNGRPEFLIDCACFPGSSGSPVLLCDVGQVPTRAGMIFGQTRVKLLGILHAGPQYRVGGAVEIVPIPTASRVVAISNIPINLGMVIKAKKLRELDDIFRELIAAKRAGPPTAVTAEP